MTFSSPAPARGQALLTTKTALSLILGLIAYFLPAVLSALGVAPEDQPGAIGLVQQIGTPLFMLAGIVFRGVASKKVTHLIPKPSTGTARLLPVFLAFLLIAPALGLSGCGTVPSDLTAPQAAKLNASRDLAAIASSLDAISNTIDGLALSRVLHGADALAAAKYLETARQTIHAGRDAYNAGDFGSVESDVAQLSTLIAALTTIATNALTQP